MEGNQPYTFWQLNLENPRDSTQEARGIVQVEILGEQGQLHIILNSAEGAFSTDEYRGWAWWRLPEFSPVDLGVIPIDAQGKREAILPFSMEDVFHSGRNFGELEGIMISHHGIREETSGSVILAAQLPEE